MFWTSIIEDYKNYGNYILQEIAFNTSPWYINYFWWLVLLSLVVWCLEILFPWRKNQSIFRKDFWKDAAYMFLNFYVFAFVISGLYSIFSFFFSELGIKNDSFSLLNLSSYHPVLQLLIFFILNDFVQWFTHLLLHKIPVFWTFHKVHHSVKEMGFAAHLRYHWMENILYKPLKVFVVMIIGGFEPQQAFIVHFIAIAIGHLNHANLNLDYGPLKYIFNNPKMHIWHHAKDLPKQHPYGMNFGISLSLWDYLFKTAYIPYSGRDIELGFSGDENFPQDLTKQIIYPISKKDE